MADLTGRSLSWAFIVYPESAPENWVSYLRGLHVDGAISPLHCDDTDLQGELKKPHFHVLLKFPTKKSFYQIKKIAVSCGFNGDPQPVESFKGYFRYLIHCDNPEKAQYDKESIIVFGDLDIDSYFMPTAGRSKVILRDIVLYLLGRPDIIYFEQLLIEFKDCPDYFSVLVNNSCYSIHQILRTRAYNVWVRN